MFAVVDITVSQGPFGTSPNTYQYCNSQDIQLQPYMLDT